VERRKTQTVVSHDEHLRVVYKPFKMPDTASGGRTSEEIAHYREAMMRNNCSFEEVRLVPHNIGYVKFTAVPDVEVCRSTLENVMKSLRHADALIFDLRNNRGGDPHMVALMCSYLFDHRTHLNDIYDRHENTTQEFWTSSPMPGNTLADKPAYVLTSTHTFSGAEEFSNDLKTLKRATIVGETTGGGAHLVQERRIDEHFSIQVPFARPINPISKADWEGTGVAPDVAVKSVDALETAERLANNRKARSETLNRYSRL
jgi:C-terminal processing protease CtpA/Prc